MPFAVAKCDTTVMLRSPLTWPTRSRRVFPPVDLAALKRRRSRKWVEGQPLDPVEMRHLGPRGEAASPGRPLSRAWPVLGETLKHDAGAADMFVLQVAERAAADDLGDRFERRLGGQPLRHDRRHIAAGSGQRLRQMRERPLQAEAHRAVVGR